MNKKITFIDITKSDNDIKQQLRYWRNQEFIRKNMFNQDIISKEDHEKFLRKLEEDDSTKVFLTFYDNRPFGVLNYHLREEDSLEFGYYLIDEKHISSGLGAVLEYVLLNHAFYNLKVKKVYCRTLTYNKKVINLHKKFGFIVQKTLKNIIKRDGKSLDACMQVIYPEIWEKQRTKIKKIIKYIIPLDDIGILKVEGK
ncbi:UDP-4-amino-4,6-dideoxy-N-acetyl-beta-L-altrosamine N-acetyltransferase [Paramaledivibacter caminithermalis]|uniref:UDP-4-amino-4,6-dideoxy-N-acetyl-beta-L-altrosamine N-acetyltransferase n=1 Tax=Paramaledivibacter caminithermalis (strain DSM 15212 / CIP 107654 / DViRD3) TaxID=1121301 RepID=A0A1M6L6X3_PARC5|nr:UDP-4-amino-4,6-dideoxy-N-acetyl-beta-L-altrosamine N-acetyltransferase [Paramaledivibacter caminithermalis]SHJ67008.1 UDP-4-amino-4,6-dideoxy-N-acetyl-beta-L-altrosamine N-acetyltransferase [Paramaledivibacter caminithermalis DSM 15212]